MRLTDCDAGHNNHVTHSYRSPLSSQYGKSEASTEMCDAAQLPDGTSQTDC